MTENQRLRRQVRQLLEEKRKLEEKIKRFERHVDWKNAVDTPAGERGYWAFKTAVSIAIVTIVWALVDSLSTRLFQMPLEPPEIRIDIQLPFGKNENP